MHVILLITGKAKFLMGSSDTLFRFPIHSILRDVTSISCMRRCLRTTGCVSYNFRLNAPVSGSEITADQKNTDAGTCVIIAPSSENVELDLQGDEEEEGWEFYGMVG